jgi:hypothetical protein
MLILLSVLTLSVTNLWAGDEVLYCFSPEQVKPLIVELEKGRICENQFDFCVKASLEAENQISILNSKITLSEEKFTACTDQLDIAKTIIQQREKEVKQASKPKWSLLFGSYGAGVVSGLLLLLLL